MSANKQASNPLPLGALNEVCIVTPDIYATISSYAKLNIGPFRVFTFDSSTVRDRRWHGGPGDFTLKVAFATVGNVTWELMQPTGGKSLMGEFLERSGGRQGVQHVAWDMGGGALDERRAMMEATGIRPAMEGCWIGKKGTCRFCFFDTEELAGTVFETIDFSDDWEDPEFELYPPQASDQQTPRVGTVANN